jgi:DNA repair protein RecO (recombination protein O)
VSDSDLAIAGILLRRVPYGDYDMVLTLLSETQGRVACFARGARRVKKNWVGSLVPGNRLIVHLAPSRRSGMSSVVSIDLMTDRSVSLAQPGRLARSAYLLELTDRVVQDGEEAAALTRACTLALDAIGLPLTSRWFELAVLRHLGIDPGAHCGSCGSFCDRGARLAWNGEGLLCADCAAGPLTLDAAAITALVELGGAPVPPEGPPNQALGQLFSALLKPQVGVLKSVALAATLEPEL